MIGEGLALIDKAMRHIRPRPLSGAGRDRGAARPRRHAGRYGLGSDRAALRHARTAAAVAGRHAQPRRRGQQGGGARGGAGADRAPGRTARLLFHFHGLKGALLKELGQAEAAHAAFDRAIALANTPAEAAHIRLHLDRLAAGA
ncbi:MAG: hypothetical protein WDN08_11900 [Rhizomicrobium sp.]